MARTYHAEGRQLANFLRVILILGGMLIYFNIPGLHWGFLLGIIVVGTITAEIAGSMWTRWRREQKELQKQQARKTNSGQRKQMTNRGSTLNNAKTGGTRSSTAKHMSPTSTGANRADDVILSSPLADLSWSEFERLLALYFRDQGYTVNEVGIGGNDGGVDLVIIDRRGEKTAVQAKKYSDSNPVDVKIVRELVAAKRNHDCILSLLITTSDLTGPAKKEAEQFKVDYWHGALLEQKLKAWGRWQPSKKGRRRTKSQASTSVVRTRAHTELTQKTELTKARKEAAATKSAAKR